MKKLLFDAEIILSLQQLINQFSKVHGKLNAANVAVLEAQLDNLPQTAFAREINSVFREQNFCLIKNVLTDDVDLIPSPLPEATETPVCLAPVVLMWLLQTIGLAVSGIEHVKNGALFHNIVPTSQADGFSQVNDAAWARQLGFHQEMAFMNRPGLICAPSILALLCLRSGVGECPATHWVKAEQVLTNLDHRCIEFLKLPIFMVKAPSFIPWEPVPQPLYYPDVEKNKYCMTYTSLYTGDQPTISIDGEACKKINISAVEADLHLNNLNRAYESVIPQSIVFERGDCLIIDNRFVQHGRTPFKPPSLDRLTMRWLLRAYALPRQYVPRDRVLKMQARMKELEYLT